MRFLLWAVLSSLCQSARANACLEDFLHVSQAYSMDWRDIPSLSALRAFEAAARLGSLSGAARELNVTHAAISQHIRQLADHFGTPLLLRVGARMEPTEAGQILATACSDGFERIAEASAHLLQTDADRPVSLSTTPSFAEFWLMPRLARFWREHPDIRLSITPEARLADLRRDGHDLAVRYGRGGWAGFEETLLVPAGLAVVMTPEVAKTDLATLTWLIEDTLPEAENWARARGLIGEGADIRHLPNPAMILTGARAGAGAAIVPEALAEVDLSRGALVRYPQSDPPDLHYYLLHRPVKLRPQVRVVMAWLKRAAQGPE